MKIKELIVCAMAMALGFIASYIKIFAMPFGGAVTLFSMFFVCLIGYWYGLKAGILGGFAYGVLQFLQEPYVLSIFQVCCDYFFAFAALGLSGAFRNQKHGFEKGFLLAVIVRGFFILWGDICIGFPICQKISHRA